MQTCSHSTILQQLIFSILLTWCDFLFVSFFFFTIPPPPSSPRRNNDAAKQRGIKGFIPNQFPRFLALVSAPGGGAGLKPLWDAEFSCIYRKITKRAGGVEDEGQLAWPPSWQQGAADWNAPERLHWIWKPSLENKLDQPSCSIFPITGDTTCDSSYIYK